DPNPQPEALTRTGKETGVALPDISLNPLPTTTAKDFLFGDPHGLAFDASDGTLYVADRRRNAIYKLLLDANGGIRRDRQVVRVIGDGMGRYAAPVGSREQGRAFSLNQPVFLMTGADGNLWIATAYGVALYEHASNDARWVFFDAALPESEVTYSLLAGP